MRELMAKSLTFDIRLLVLRRLSLRQRISFVSQKWKALLLLTVARRRSRIRVGRIDFEVRDISGLGTLQSNIIDFHRDIARLGVLPPDPVVIDVGANVGQFCSSVKLFYPDAKIHSFEPDPDTYAVLVDNTMHMSTVTTYRMGLSNRADTIPFFRAPLTSMSGFLPNSASVESLDLDVDRLDAALPVLDVIDLLKIDVEGLEYEVLEGAEAVLDRVRWLIVEIGLGRNATPKTNLELLGLLMQRVPNARLVKTGRPLGDGVVPACQDFVFDLRGRGAP